MQLISTTRQLSRWNTKTGEIKVLQVVAANDVGPWESGDSISEIYMGLNPTGFAVKSYLHLTQLQDPQPFIKILLNNNWFYVSVP